MDSLQRAASAVPRMAAQSNAVQMRTFIAPTVSRRGAYILSSPVVINIGYESAEEPVSGSGAAEGTWWLALNTLEGN